jgi:L-fuconolactonase
MNAAKPVAPAGFIPVREDWVSRLREPVVEPDLPIIDPHHHLWDRLEDRPSTRYMLEDALRDFGSGHNIVATVFVQCRAVYRTRAPRTCAQLARRNSSMACRR